MPRAVSAAEAQRMMADGDELALVDVREITAFGTGHPLLAANLPLSVLEPAAMATVPRRGTCVVLLDGGGGEADIAAGRLQTLGYDAVHVVDGGAPAWAAAGQALLPEIEVPAKGFGAFARRFGKPDFIEPEELARWLEGAEDCIVLDSRPRREYGWGHIPGGTNAPGADLVRWFDDLVPDPETKVVINCMSGTRGILGGLSLRAAGVPNEIRVLHHGTRNWLIAGLELEQEASRHTDPATPAALRAARPRAARIAEAAGIARIDHATLGRWRAEPNRTTYLFDVRTADEFVVGHLAGAVNAPEGTLVMSHEHYFATLHARYVIADDDGVRAVVTALWLKMMGWGEEAVLADGLADAELITGAPLASPVQVEARRRIAPRDLAALDQARIVDIGHSDAYVAGHVPGAAWCSRPVLADTSIEGEGPLVVSSEDGAIAALAADELGAEALVLEGGLQAWVGAGLEVETGEARLLSPRVDHWLASSERPGDARENVEAYLDWEVGLYDDIAAGGTVPYRDLIWGKGT